jgi:hypothetical protein
MNIFLWIIQLTLAVLCLSGGSYKIFMFDELAKMPATGALSPSDGPLSACSRWCAGFCWSCRLRRSGCQS